jgi:hypothetical protein
MVKKVFIILISSVLLFSIINMYLFPNVGYAEFSVGTTFGGDINKDAKDAQTATLDIIATVLAVIRIVAAGIAITILIVLGCKYMLSSAGDRADIKKYAMNYVIGAFILFGATALVSIAKVFIDSVF